MEKVISGLWGSGVREDCSLLISDYLSEMSNRNRHWPEAGNRLTLDRLMFGIRQAPIGRLEPDQLDDLIAILRRIVS